MKRIAAILLMITVPLSAIPVPGRASEFIHIDSRWKEVAGRKRGILLTGQPNGLMLQILADEKVFFPDGLSTVLTPNGRRINLKFKKRDDVREVWNAKFADPHLLIEGMYMYDITVNINGRNSKFFHSLAYSFQNIEPGFNSWRQISPFDRH